MASTLTVSRNITQLVHVCAEHKKTPGGIWMFPKILVPQNGWFIMENPIIMDDLGVPLFLETPICSLIDVERQTI